MTEPVTTTAALTGGFAAALIAWFGPAAPDYVLMLACALIGVLHPLSKRPFDGWVKPIYYVVMWTATAGVLTGISVWALEFYLSVPASKWPGVVAFFITFLSDRWPAWATALLDWKLGRVAGRADGISNAPMGQAQPSQRGPL
jgi:hypothetical protein